MDTPTTPSQETFLTTRTKTAITYRKSRTPYEKDMLHYIAHTYRHIAPNNETISLPNFADLIAKVYDPTLPRTAEIIRILRA